MDPFPKFVTHNIDLPDLGPIVGQHPIPAGKETQFGW